MDNKTYSFAIIHPESPTAPVKHLLVDAESVEVATHKALEEFEVYKTELTLDMEPEVVE